MRNTLYQCQHAYREGWSVEIALCHLMDVLRDDIETKEIALCAFLDIKGAFDNTSHSRRPDPQGSGKHLGFLNGQNVRE